MSNPESKYADKLRELGFYKQKSTLPRKQRRKMHIDSKRGLLRPTYSPYDYGPGLQFTLLTDETGQLWRVNRLVDLSVFGFRNNVHWFENTVDGKSTN